MNKKMSPINIAQAQQVERHKFSLFSKDFYLILIGFLFGTFAGWCGAWIVIGIYR